MIITNAQPIKPSTTAESRRGAEDAGLTKGSYPMPGVAAEAGGAGGLFGDLEGGLLLAPPDLPLAGGGPLLLGDVLVGLDDGLLDVLDPRLARVLVALLALVVAVRPGLLVFQPLLEVLLELQQSIHRFLLAHQAHLA